MTKAKSLGYSIPIRSGPTAATASTLVNFQAKEWKEKNGKRKEEGKIDLISRLNIGLQK